MAFSRPLLVSLLLLAFALQLVHSRPALPETSELASTGRSLLQYFGPTSKIDCRPACDQRCAKSWRLNMCKKMCAVCCNKCNCVPEGTEAEARNACPCYANMKSTKGQYKCP